VTKIFVIIFYLFEIQTSKVCKFIKTCDFKHKLSLLVFVTVHVVLVFFALKLSCLLKSWFCDISILHKSPWSWLSFQQSIFKIIPKPSDQSFFPTMVKYKMSFLKAYCFNNRCSIWFFFIIIITPMLQRLQSARVQINKYML
jgi:hypothetical protein